MSPNSGNLPLRNGVERVRHELLTALHFGKLGPGDRVPSVRRLAEVTGMNRKTIHRAYRRLADEGLLDLRPGSGTFITDRIGGGPGPTSVSDLMLAINRSRATAESLGLNPAVFGSFLEIHLGARYRGVAVTVSECNGEQRGLIAQELRAGIGLDARPCLLEDLRRRPEAALVKTEAVITTDCHSAEVADLVAPVGLPVFKLALDPGFPLRIVEHARQGPVLMVVSDRDFGPVFRRLLAQMAVPDKLVRRLEILEPREAKARLWDLDESPTLVVSPLVEDSWRNRSSGRFRQLSGHWRIEAASLDRLRAGLALQLARRKHSQRHSQRHAQPRLQEAPERGASVQPS